MNTTARQQAKRLECFALIHGWRYLNEDEQALVTELRADRVAAAERRAAKKAAKGVK